MVGKGTQYVVGIWLVYGRYVVTKGGQYLLAMWLVCSWHVVGKGGRYVVGRESDVVGKWSVKYIHRQLTSSVQEILYVNKTRQEVVVVFLQLVPCLGILDYSKCQRQQVLMNRVQREWHNTEL